MNPRVVVYRKRLARRNQRWRWRLVVSGRQKANGGEGYSDKARAYEAARDVLSGIHAGDKVIWADE